MDILDADSMLGPDRDEILQCLGSERFLKDGGWTKPDQPLTLEGVSWTPEFVKGDAALVLLMGDQTPRFLRKRLLAARKGGITLVCAVDSIALSSSETIRLLSQIDASISLFTNRSFSEPQPLLKFLGAEQIAINADIRQELIDRGLQECGLAATNDKKGRTLEWLLHFMFSQINGFRVRECNYRTASEELDVVIQLTTLDGSRCWSHMNAPFLVAEAKNRQEKSGQEVVSKLNTIISVKRGTCKIGFVVSLSGFSSDARTQVLKLASVDRIFVLMDMDTLRRWASASDYDGELDDIVSEAALN